MRILNWTFLTRSSDLSKPLQTYRPTKFLQFSFPQIRKAVAQKRKLKLLELHLATGFTKFFIKLNFICRFDIRTYHGLLVEYIELLNTAHFRNIRVSCGQMLLFIVMRSST